MKSLIYTVAYGQDYWEQAKIMVASLRTWGGYEGDVIVYADHDGVIDGARVMRDTTPLALPHIFMARAMLGRNLPGGYDRILSLDADIAVINSIQPILEFPYKLSLPPERISHLDHCRDWFFMPGTDIHEGDIGYNAGTIGAEAGLFHRLCHVWWDFMLERKSWTIPGGIDQQPLNHIVRSGHFSFTAFPKEWFFFFNDPDDYWPVTRQTIIAHPKQHKQSHQQMFLNMRSLWKD